MKKIITFLLVTAMLAAMVGCASPKPAVPGEKPADVSEKPDDEAIQPETEITVPEEVPVEVLPEEEQAVPEPEVPQGEPAEVDVATLPDSLKSFLLQFTGWFRDPEGRTGKAFDCKNASDGSSNIMMNIVSNGSCVDFDQYLGVSPVYHWYDSTPDPRNWWPEVGSYAVFDGATVDWIAENVFNITEKDIAALVKQAENMGEFYKGTDADGNYCYYAPLYGVGDPFIDIEITHAEFDGKKYYLDYDLYQDVGGEERTYLDSYYTVLELKKMDGSVYWSMYSHASLNEI